MYKIMKNQSILSLNAAVCIILQGKYMSAGETIGTICKATCGGLSYLGYHSRLFVQSSAAFSRVVGKRPLARRNQL